MRHLIEARVETWNALEQMALDDGRSLSELAEEAFGDLLHKHGRPTSLLDALRRSARQHPANDDEAPRSRRRS